MVSVSLSATLTHILHAYSETQSKGAAHLEVVRCCGRGERGLGARLQDNQDGLGSAEYQRAP